MIKLKSLNTMFYMSRFTGFLSKVKKIYNLTFIPTQRSFSNSTVHGSVCYSNADTDKLLILSKNKGKSGVSIYNII